MFVFGDAKPAGEEVQGTPVTGEILRDGFRGSDLTAGEPTDPGPEEASDALRPQSGPPRIGRFSLEPGSLAQ